MLIFILIGCQQSSNDTTQQTSAFSIGESFHVSWQSDLLFVRISQGEEGSWWFGIAETDPTLADPWTGEDCHNGDSLDGETSIVWCHPIEAQGTSLNFGGSPTSLNPELETAMPVDGYLNQPMYYFVDVITEECFISGDGAQNYSDLCTNIVPMDIEEPTE